MTQRIALGIGAVLVALNVGALLLFRCPGNGNKSPAPEQTQSNAGAVGKTLAATPDQRTKLANGNGGEQSVPPSGDGDNDGGEMISIPRATLRHFHNPVFFGLTPLMDTRLAADLGLSDSQVKLIEATATEAVESLVKLEAQRVELKEDDSGGQYYRIPSLDKAGEKIRAQLAEKIGQATDRSAAAVLMHGIDRSQLFAEFGKHERQLSIIIKETSDGTPLYFFEQVTIQPDGRRSGNRRVKVQDVEEFEKRYGLLFKTPSE